MLLITLFPGFRNGRQDGCGILAVAKNGPVGPKLAKIKLI